MTIVFSNIYFPSIYIYLLVSIIIWLSFIVSLLNKKVSKKEYEEIIDYAYDIGVRNAYVQDEGTCKKIWVP